MSRSPLRTSIVDMITCHSDTRQYVKITILNSGMYLFMIKMHKTIKIYRATIVIIDAWRLLKGGYGGWKLL